jgi:hypothetical protein
VKVFVADVARQWLYASALLRCAGHECILCAGRADVLVTLSQPNTAFVVSEVRIPNFDVLSVSRAIRGTDYDRYLYILLIIATRQTGATTATVWKRAPTISMLGRLAPRRRWFG